MRKSKTKVEDTLAKVTIESENGEEIGEEERPVSPTSSKSTRRSKKASSVDGSRNKRKKVEEELDEEVVEKMEDKSDSSDEDEIPLSKKMKAVKRTQTNNGVAKGKKRVAEATVLKEEYEVESVVGSRLQRGKRQFRIRWKGFKEEEDTWEAEEGLDCTDAIQQYLSTHPEEEDSAGQKPKRSTKKVNKKASKKSDEVAQDGDEEVSTEEFEVERIMDMFIKKKQGKREFLIRWKGYSSREDTWEPEEHLNCGDLIEKYMIKVNAAKAISEKELRISRKPTDRFTLTTGEKGRRIGRRNQGKQRARYDDAE